MIIPHDVDAEGIQTQSQAHLNPVLPVLGGYAAVVDFPSQHDVVLLIDLVLSLLDMQQFLGLFLHEVGAVFHHY